MGEILPKGGQISTEACEATRRDIAARLFEREQLTPLIEYPYMPEQGSIQYVPADNEFMIRAKEFARLNSLDKGMPNCSIVVKNGVEIGIAANGSDHHDLHSCERKRLGSKTGEDYDKCEGCHPKNHGESKAVADTLSKVDAETMNGAEIYLWGHWWCCEPCWDVMLANGINVVYLLEDSQVLFDREKPGNIISRQFEA